MIRRLTLMLCVMAVVSALPSAALAQKSVADVLGRTATPEGQPKSYLEEIMLFSYVENSYVANLGRTGRGNVNELRFYDHDNGYTFNAAEFNIKKDPSERYRLGWGVVITGGMDSQKNHSLGIFRDSDDGGPFFRNTAKYDLAEAYLSYLVPVGEGLTLKAGKWATLIGYEVYESPKNLNFSRSFLYTLGTPYFHTGLLATYPVTKWFSVTAGFTNGWDNADNNNGHLRPTGNFAFTPTDKLSATVSWFVGPEQNRNQMHGGGSSSIPPSCTRVSTAGHSPSTSTSPVRRRTHCSSERGATPTRAGAALPATWRTTGPRRFGRRYAWSTSPTRRACAAARRSCPAPMWISGK